MKGTAFLFIIILTANALFAQDDSGYVSSRELTLQVSTLPEAKLAFNQRFVFPFLQGGSPLMEGNNLRLDLTAEITPISINGIFKTTLTPIAFIELCAGVRLGAGWPLNLFGGDIYGTGISSSNNTDGKLQYEGSVFDALLWKGFAGGTFQFDLAAVLPGDWNHIVFLTYHEINYHGNTKAKSSQSWYYESGSGENMNGFNYYGNFLIGYQMPIFINLFAFLVEMDLYLYDTPGRSEWGDDLIRWTFAAALGFQITPRFSITVLTQMRSMRNYTNDNWEDLYYKNRRLDTSNPLRVEFYRVAAALSYKL